MALYSVHLQGDGRQYIADAAFVRQAFSWKAFFFGPFWLAQHRLWAGLALWSAAYLILIVAARTIVPADAAFLIAFALQILLGLEANRLSEAKLEAQGYRLAEIVAAPSREAAEIAFFRQIEAPDAAQDSVPGAQDSARV